jgi:hypothetical protein
MDERHGPAHTPSAFTGGPIDVSQFGTFDTAAWSALRGGRALKKSSSNGSRDQPYYLARYTSAPLPESKRERLHHATMSPGESSPNPAHRRNDARAAARAFNDESLLERLKAAVPGNSIVAQELLDDYDSYYYSAGRRRCRCCA